VAAHPNADTARRAEAGGEGGACRAEAGGEGGDEELLARFQDGSMPDGAFHHEQHVRVAWTFVRRYGMPDALGRFSAALRRFAEAKGKPGLYHETITWAYLLLIAERVARGTGDDSWDRFADANADLLTWKPSLLDRYYAPGTLQSELSRRTFLMPDRF
jgi:hypothetical protein